MSAMPWWFSYTVATKVGKRSLWVALRLFKDIVCNDFLDLWKYRRGRVNRTLLVRLHQTGRRMKHTCKSFPSETSSSRLINTSHLSPQFFLINCTWCTSATVKGNSNSNLKYKLLYLSQSRKLGSPRWAIGGYYCSNNGFTICLSEQGDCRSNGVGVIPWPCTLSVCTIGMHMNTV
jgi:hypothetical protein